MVAVAIGEDRCHRKRRDGMAGGEACLAFRERFVRPEPCVVKITVRWNVGWPKTAINMLHHRRQDFRVSDGFARQQGRVLAVRVLANQGNRVKRQWDNRRSHAHVRPAEDLIELVESGSAAEIGGVRQFESHRPCYPKTGDLVVTKRLTREGGAGMVFGWREGLPTEIPDLLFVAL